MNLTEPQTRYLTTLRSGQGIVYTEGMRKPVLLQVALAPTKRLPGRLEVEKIRQAMMPFWEEHKKLKYPFAACSSCPRGMTGEKCGAREVDESLVGAFRRLFNAIGLNHTAVSAAYREFEQMYQRGASHFGSKNQAKLNYAVLTGATLIESYFSETILDSADLSGAKFACSTLIL